MGKVLAGVVDSHGRVLARERRDTPGRSVKAVEDTILDLVALFSKSFNVTAVGIGAAGFVDASRSVVMFSPHLAWATGTAPRRGHESCTSASGR